jgi:hypothetical protein
MESNQRVSFLAARAGAGQALQQQAAAVEGMIDDDAGVVANPISLHRVVRDSEADTAATLRLIVEAAALQRRATVALVDTLRGCPPARACAHHMALCEVEQELWRAQDAIQALRASRHGALGSDGSGGEGRGGPGGAPRLDQSLQCSQVPALHSRSHNKR